MKGRTAWIILVVSVVLSMLTGLVACAPAATPTPAADKPAAEQPAAEQPKAEATQPPAAASGDEQVELRIAWWGSQDRHDRTIKVIEMFMQQHPNIKITYEFAGWDDYWTKMTTQAAGNNLPDIMQQDYAYLKEWTKKDLILPLDQYRDDGTIKFDDIAEASIAGGIIDGKLYAVNLGNNSQTIVLDKDAFAAAGVELPPTDWTWKQFEEVVMQLHEKTGGTPMGPALWNDQFFKNIFISRGENFYDPSGTKLGFTDPQPLIDHFNMLLRLQTAGAMISREDEVANKYTLETDPIVTKQTMMMYTNSNQIIAMWKAAGEDRNFVMYPLPRSDKPTNYYKPSQFWSITSKTKHPKEAAMFIEYFTNDLEANKALMAERGVPIAAHIRDGLKPLLGKAQAEMFDYITRLEGNTSPLPLPDPAGHPDIAKNVWLPQIVDPIMYGQAKPEEVLPTLLQEATTILAKNKQ